MLIFFLFYLFSIVVFFQRSCGGADSRTLLFSCHLVTLSPCLEIASDRLIAYMLRDDCTCILPATHVRLSLTEPCEVQNPEFEIRSSNPKL